MQLKHQYNSNLPLVSSQYWGNGGAVISIRDFQIEDIEPLMNYWYRSPHGFVDSLGVDPKKFPREPDFRANMLAKFDLDHKKGGQKSSALVIEKNFTPIGVHTLFPYQKGKSGIFHAHIWSKTSRGQGFGRLSYPLAMKVYFERFRLEKIEFKTPIQNLAAIRVKECLGIRFVREETIDFSIIKAGTKARVYECLKEELSDLIGSPTTEGTTSAETSLQAKNSSVFVRGN